MPIPNLFSPKTPADEILYSFDFSNFLARGETIVTASVTCSPSDITCGAAIISSGRIPLCIVTSLLSGGVAERSYEVSFTINTSLGQEETRSAILNVYEFV